jgi:hypothetical protein
MAIRKILAALCIAGMVVAGLGVTLYLLSHKDVMTTAKSGLTSAEAPPASVPTPEEFKVGINVTATNCDAADKCTFTYSIAPNYTGKHPLPEHGFAVFYEVTGGFEPQSGTFTVSNGQARVYKDVQIDGAPGSQFQAAVTKVSAVAGPMPVS